MLPHFPSTKGRTLARTTTTSGSERRPSSRGSRTTGTRGWPTTCISTAMSLYFVGTMPSWICTPTRSCSIMTRAIRRLFHRIRTMRTWSWIAIAFVAAGSGACAPQAPVAVKTGAEEAARAYCDALVRKDWPRAYGLLRLESPGRLSEPQFTGLGENYLRGFGFTPQEVFIRSCEERGAEAKAQIRFRGHAGSKLR